MGTFQSEPNIQKIKLNLGIYNETKTFNNLADFENWLSDEKTNLINWISPLRHKNIIIDPIFNHLNQYHHQVYVAISNIKQRINAPEFDTVLKHNVEIIERIYSENKLINSSSPRGKFIFKKKEKDELMAAFSLGYFIGVPFADYHPKLLEGIFSALQFDNGLESNIDAEKEALMELRTEWNNNYDELGKKYQSANSNLEKLSDDYQKQIDSQQEAFENFKKKSEKDLQNVTDTYDRQLSLQSSITYWKRKLKSHKNLSCVFAVISVLSVILMMILIYFAGKELVKNNSIFTSSDSGSNALEHWELIVFAIFVSLGIWLIRILVRIFLSNLHLTNDAHERVTMITTYLAMLRSGHALKDEDKQLILQVIFRPSISGLIKDEAAPPTIIDIFAKLNNGKR